MLGFDHRNMPGKQITEISSSPGAVGEGGKDAIHRTDMFYLHSGEEKLRVQHTENHRDVRYNQKDPYEHRV